MTEPTVLTVAIQRLIESVQARRQYDIAQVLEGILDSTREMEAAYARLARENAVLRQQVGAAIRRDSIEADTVSDEFIWSWEQLDDAVGEWKAVGDTVEG